jgi:hypothetical protein
LILEELFFWDPFEHARLQQMYDLIHAHFMMGYDRDGMESFYISREVEKLSRSLERLYNNYPWADHRLADLASHLKYMGRDVQIGPRRKRFHRFPRPRYHDGRFYGNQRRRRW